MLPTVPWRLLRRAALLGPLALGACGRGEPAAPHRLLVVGLDGATFDVIDPLLAAGRLPNLAALIERGVQARLASTRIPISSAAWVGATTGCGPGESGVYGFFERVPGSYDVVPVSARSVRAPPLWRILTAEGIESVVFGVPLTYPPEPILGTLVAGMLSPRDADYAWPPGYADALRARGFEPDLATWLEDRPLTVGRVEAQLALKRTVLGELLAGEGWRFAMVVFKSLDTLSHRAYGDDFAEQIAPTYEALDAALGELVRQVGPDTNVVVLSDHGFRPYSFGLDLHAWLLEAGFAAAAPGADGPAPTPDGPLIERRPAERAARLAGVDLARTRAYAGECAGNFGTLWLNLAGREPRGSVAPAEAEGVLAELEAALRALRDPDGRPLVVDVRRGAELYPGPFGATAAGIVSDLVVEARAGVHVVARGGGPVFGAYARAIPDHDRFGVFAAAGPDLAHDPARGEVDVLDLAPTALHILGRAVPTRMQGRVLERWTTRAATPRRPAGERSVAQERAPAAPFTAEEIEELRRRLAASGYGE